jgi:hypothetical protein
VQRQWLSSYFTGQRSSRLIPELSRPAAQEPRSRTASAIDPVQLAAIDAGVKDGQDAIDAEAADCIVQAWMVDTTGGIVVAVIITVVAYSGGDLSSVPAPNPGAEYQTLPIAPTTAPPELPKP